MTSYKRNESSDIELYEEDTLVCTIPYKFIFSISGSSKYNWRTEIRILVDKEMENFAEDEDEVYNPKQTKLGAKIFNSIISASSPSSPDSTGCCYGLDEDLEKEMT